MAKREPIADDDRQNELRLEEERVLNTYDDSSDYATTTQLKNVEDICDSLKIDIVNESKDKLTLEFDLKNVEAPIANTLRRVLIAEVPTMAFEKIYLYQNTSIIQDEVLCHRLGLLPLKVDPRRFDMPLTKVVGINEKGVDCDEEPEPNEKYNVVFNINVSCTKNSHAPSTATEPNVLYHNSSIYSESFKWKPCGDQEAEFGDDPPRMVHEDILVAKMRPGQQIEANCHAVKGIGRDHAKFSPVATASYRLLPTIRITKPVVGEAAELLQGCFSKGVIDIVTKNGINTAVVADARRDTCSRNVFRYQELAECVELGRKKNHFIFCVESTGALTSAELVVEACKVVEEKCASLHKEISDAFNSLMDI